MMEREFGAFSEPQFPQVEVTGTTIHLGALPPAGGASMAGCALHKMYPDGGE
jgi:hypothetical protein